MVRLVYDEYKCVMILMDEWKYTEEDALDHISYNHYGFQDASSPYLISS
jgi:hypothetical protein